MKIEIIKTYGIMLLVTGILFGLLFYPENTKATILSGLDEPTGNAYEDAYIAEEIEENTTITSGSNQTMDTNNSTIIKS